ncbi:MAG: hypothetical protein JWL81_3451 [Verrucomicrobiales bacterium]|nr:hypothetical protein [Verrucomicrobiales bacterium]
MVVPPPSRGFRLPRFFPNRQLTGPPAPGGLRGLFLALFLILLSALAQAQDFTATLAQDSVPEGQGAQLTIKVSKGNLTSVEFPEVPDLIAQQTGSSAQMEMSPEGTKRYIVVHYMIGSMKAGSYTVPPITLTIDGQDYKTQSFKLTVTPSPNRAPAGLNPSNNSNPANSPLTTPEQTAENAGFLTVQLAGKERKHVWVGEIAPVRITAWFRPESNPSLVAPLQTEGSSFTLHNLSPRPSQDQEVLGGKQYLTVTWFGGLSATKAGTSPPDLSLKVSVASPDPHNRRRPSGDPFLDQFLGNRMIRKEAVLHSKTDASAQLEVRPLPTEGQPADFQGAVGKFKFGAPQFPSEWRTGEPASISVAIEGEGNFNLLQQPVLTSDHSWKSYPGKSNFTPRDAASFSGATTFQFSQVPRQSGPQQIQLTASYFDPDLASYQTISTPPVTINVTGTDLPPEPEVKAPATAATPPPAEPGLAPQRVGAGFSSDLRPLFLRPAFKANAVLCLAISLGALLLRYHRHHHRNPNRLARIAREKAYQSALSQAHAAASLQDVPAFFQAARTALQYRLAALWHRPAPAITTADADKHLPRDSPVLTFLREADRLDYSPHNTLTAATLPTWQAHFRQALDSLPSA